MNVVLAKSETQRAVDDIFISARDRLPGAGKVLEVRQRAFEAYGRAGLPHRRLEDWKYTDLRALMREVLTLAVAPDASALKRSEAALTVVSAVDSCRLVLVDGVFAPQLSDLAALEAGVRVKTLREILEDSANAARVDLLENGAASGAMIALNAAMATDGV